MTSLTVLRQPSYVRVHTENAPYTIRGRNSKNVWQFEGIGVTTNVLKDRLKIELTSAVEPVRYIEFRWQQLIPEGMKYLGDHWERGYGDMSWMGMTPDKPMPWYFFAYDGKQMFACGVKTGAGAFCWWHVDPYGIRLWMDVRSGGEGVKLGGRSLDVATVVERNSQESETPYESASRFTAIVCDKPLLPKQPIYGVNNFYYAYGESSHDQVLQDSKLVSDLSGNQDNRPFSIIDMGWENTDGSTTSQWRSGNKRFPDMAGTAAKIKKAGARPGLWYRPLLANRGISKSWILECRQEMAGEDECIMDPTVPDVLERIKQDVSLMSEWGYDLIKHDCTTHDLLGTWGAMMGRRVTEDGWHFADQSKTNAEILISLYAAIHSAAKGAMLMGCNTVGHLCAGYVHSNRIGDNTSGRDWLITRKMGINSLAFRALQHGYLFATDADCVGMTSHIPWRLNEQWLGLLAASGTSMFVSVQANYVKEKQRIALKQAFERASRPQPLIQPIDWMQNACPARWKSGEEFFEFQLVERLIVPTFDLVEPTRNCERFRCFQGWQRTRSDSERLSEQELWLVWAGRGRMKTRDAEYELRPGFCVWMRPGKIYDAVQDEEDRIGLTFIHFNFQNKALNKSHAYPEFYDVGDINYVDSVSRRIVEIMRQFDSPQELKTAAGLLLSGLLLDLVTKFRYEDKNPSSPVARHHKDLIQQTVRSIFETVESPLSVKELARKAGYSPAHFSSLFKKVTGQTVEAVIVQARIDKARQLLRQSDLSIGQVAEATGYRDVYFFSRQFKFKTGQTPTKYRISQHEEMGKAKKGAGKPVSAA